MQEIDTTRGENVWRLPMVTTTAEVQLSRPSSRAQQFSLLAATNPSPLHKQGAGPLGYTLNLQSLAEPGPDLTKALGNRFTLQLAVVWIEPAHLRTPLRMNGWMDSYRLIVGKLPNL